MAMPVVSLGEYEALQAELKASQQHLRGKDQGLHILKRELDREHEHVERCHQEIAQLRSQLARSPLATPASRQDAVREREQLISQLEEAQKKISSLERQVQMEVDEKEEVACERDYYSTKCESMLKCLEEQKQSQPPSQTAVQHLMEENRQLKLELVEVKAEKERALNRIERYKRAVERRKAREQQLQVITNKHQDLRQSVRRAGELELLANSLSESVKDKSLALQHQKKTNKMLAARIADLEHRLRVMEISELWTSEDTSLSELLWSEDPSPQSPLLPPTQAPVPLTPNTVGPPNPPPQDSGRGKEGGGEECTSTDTLQPSREHEEEEGSFTGSSSVRENTSAMVNLA